MQSIQHDGFPVEAVMGEPSGSTLNVGLVEPDASGATTPIPLQIQHLYQGRPSETSPTGKQQDPASHAITGFASAAEANAYLASRQPTRSALLAESELSPPIRSVGGSLGNASMHAGLSIDSGALSSGTLLQGFNSVQINGSMMPLPVTNSPAPTQHAIGSDGIMTLDISGVSDIPLIPGSVITPKPRSHEITSACVTLSALCNRISSAGEQTQSMTLPEQQSLRQDLWDAVSALDKIFFLTAGSPAFLGIMPQVPLIRKRALTLGSADGGDEQSKHRRTSSDAFGSINHLDATRMQRLSPSSNGPLSIPPRPSLVHHTHSSPLLPVENHYQPNSTGITEVAPHTTATDLAVSGSHFIGKMPGKAASISPTPLSMSILASDANMHNGMDVQSTPRTKSINSRPLDASGSTATRLTVDIDMPVFTHTFEASAMEALVTTATPSQTPLNGIIPGTVMRRATTTSAGIPSVGNAASSTSQPQTSSLVAQAYAEEALRQQQSELDALAYAQLRVQQAGMVTAGNLLASNSALQSMPVGPTIYADMSHHTTANSPLIPLASMPVTQGLFADMTNLSPDERNSAVPNGRAGSSTPTNGVPIAMPGTQAPTARVLPGVLDFTTLQTVKEEDVMSLTTSPYASSQLSSVSSFAFTSATGMSAASGSRSRATSISKALTSGARSRAPSTSNVNCSYMGAPDAGELASMLQTLQAIPSPTHDDDDTMDDDHSEYDPEIAAATRDTNKSPSETSPSRGGEAHAHTFDPVFIRHLETVCADVDAVDRKGERLHQPLLAKRMQKFDDEHAFRPFKFRIQPFTNSFQDACRNEGLDGPEMAPKKIKEYLWNQPLISRFNDEGKKSKSKGNHVWSIEGRALGNGRFEFRPPAPRIVPLPPTAMPGNLFTWSPKVMDSSCCGQPMDAAFSADNLPIWLEFREGTLQGVPPDNAMSISVDVMADYASHRLTQSFTIAVVGPEGIRSLQEPFHPPEGSDLQHSALRSVATAGKQQVWHIAQPLDADPSAAMPLSTPPKFSSAVFQPRHDVAPLVPQVALSKVPGRSTYVPGSLPGSPTSPQQGAFATFPGSAYVSPTDSVTLASASQIKAKLVEETTAHQDNLKVLNPALPPPNPQAISQVVDTVIAQKLAVTASNPAMPSASEVFNATLQISAASSQIRQNEMHKAVAAHIHHSQAYVPAPPQVSSLQQSTGSQVAAQLQNFTFLTPSQTPANQSLETPIQLTNS